jgi:glycosyltransferase involved in cell wall biosynthesis
MWDRVLGGMTRAGMKLDFVDMSRRRPFGRRPDVWLTSGHLGALDVAEPVVAHLHEAPWLEPDDQQLLDPAFRAFYRERSDASARQAALIITPSEFARLQVIDTHQVEASKVRAVPHGVDTEVFSPSRREAGAALVRDAGGALPFVAFVSTVHPRKNLPALRAAMTILAARGVEHRLVLVLSPAPDRQDSTELERAGAADLPGHAGRTVVLRGLSELEVASVMAGADALCAPSWSEGFGFAPLEAMACGTPVVVSNRGSLPEVVGNAGLVVEPEPQAIADALESVLRDPERSALLGQAGRERSRSFSWNATTAGWIDVLQEAANR